MKQTALTHAVLLLAMILPGIAATPPGKTKVSIVGEDFHINGRPTYAGRVWKGHRIEGLLLNSRMVQATFDDLNPETVKRWAYPDTGKWDAERNVREFIAAMPEWKRHGLLAVTVNFQGGSPEGYSSKQTWETGAFTAEGALRPEFAERIRRVLDAADEQGMAVILGYFYFGQDQHLRDEPAVNRATDEATRWLLDGGWRNVLVEVNNETNVRSYEHEILRPARVHELITRVRQTEREGRRLLVGTSYGGGSVPKENVVRASDFLLLHGNGVTNSTRIAEMVRQTRAVPGYQPVPILFNEDDHENFDQSANNFAAAIAEHVSWGWFDFRRKGEGMDEGYQSPPVNWGISSERKRAFFKYCAEITGPVTPAGAAGEPPVPVSKHDQPRLIILADMGNEPDEEQQMAHMLACSSEFQLEGLIAVTGKYLRPEHKQPYRQKLHPELFTRLIDGYARVYPNLKLHAAGWPTPEYLHGIVAGGQTGYGIAATGEGKASAGSKLIIDAVTKADARPVHIVVNAGANTLAQALRDYRATHSAAELKAFVAKLRVFENGAQDNAGAWICHEFPDIFWVRSNFQTYCFGGPANTELGPHNWKPYPYSPDGQDEWAAENVRINHGALGELYPVRGMGNRIHFLEGGGTIPWMGLVCHGLTDSAEPSWGGWSGRFSAERILNVWSRHSDIKTDEQAYVPFSVYTEVKDRWTDPEDGKVYDDSSTPIWRWRIAMWNDFKARMDWCVQPYAKANHHPVAVLNGDTSDAILKRSAKPGEVLKFDASGSTDPDQDALRFSWWIYPEAGRQPCGKALPIENSSSEKISLIIPPDAAGRELHLILEVWDQSGIVPLVDYRRVVINVAK